ncbi:hypothetical protein AX14_001594 [Amanita brunnescens Koide BX004]|nr:hypothetical protein AX14_001594 [Amanita brunnescens Koide BX004]
MVTRATNASKHPGFLALDDEDLKSMQKKKEAASRRQAKAAEKKFLEARLVANTNRIAAFEDVLSIQHADKIANAARPTTRASQVKATKARPAEPVSDVSESVPADRDHVPENPNQELVESEASRADDTDYAPSSEGESERLTDANGNDEKVPSTGPKYCRKGAKRRDARARIEAYRQVESSTKDMYLASKSTNIGKHKLANSDPEAVQSGKRRRTNDSDSRHAALAPTPAGENDRFNLDYGGIMDEDMQEMAPLPVKPSQVKVTTKVEHDVPLIKVEALDPGLPGRRRGKVKDRSSQARLDLDSRQLERWKKVLVPAFRSILGVQTNPWDNSNPDLLVELKYIYQLVFPDAPRQIEHNGPEYLIVSVIIRPSKSGCTTENNWQLN